MLPYFFVLTGSWSTSEVFMDKLINLEKINSIFYGSTLKAANFAINKFDSLMGMCVIGSSIEGDWDDNSDIDLVIILPNNIDFEQRVNSDIELSDLNLDKRVQLIYLSYGYLVDYHFKNFTTMAHSISKGVIIYDKSGLLTEIYNAVLGNPTKDWIKEWFNFFEYSYISGVSSLKFHAKLHRSLCKDKCECEISNLLARAMVNWSILYLELNGIVPTTKKQILKGMFKINNDLVFDLKIALDVRRNDLYLNLNQAKSMYKSVNVLKRELQDKLGVRLEGVRGN